MECDAKKWTCEDVALWLRKCNFEKYADSFRFDHAIDGEALLALSETDLRQPPLELRILGDIKRLGVQIRHLQLAYKTNQSLLKNVERCSNESGSTNTAYNTFDNILSRNNAIDEDASRTNSSSSSRPVSTSIYAKIPTEYVDASLHKRLSHQSTDYYNGVDTRIRYESKTNDDCDKNVSFETSPSVLDPEPWKTALSFVYVFTVFWITAFVMVIVHDRVPDMDKYPPLPDLFLDNMPYVPWAFKCCEVIAIIMGCIWIIIIFFHKHRFILLRRLFCLTGTVFMLRSVSMVITSMSVPGVHLDCQVKVNDDIWSKLQRTIVIWRGFGMSLQGVRTCGDYMFSGHTVIITMLNFFITEYTPRVRMYYLHTLTWVLNLFGIFFILAAHEHYSIDVFVAFYITSRLFLYYHTLANNRGFIADIERTRVWFPLFSFFESRCNGVVPNEYDWPLARPAFLGGLFARVKGR